MKFITTFTLKLVFGLLVSITAAAQSDISYTHGQDNNINASTSTDAKINIIMIGHNQAGDNIWPIIFNGAKQAAVAANSIVDIRTTQSTDYSDMSTLIEQAVSDSPNGLIVSIPDASLVESAITKALQAEIPVVSINAGAAVYESLGINTYVGQDEYKAGFAAGERLSDQGYINAICLEHETGNVTFEQRCQGFIDGFTGQVTHLKSNSTSLSIINTLKTAISDDPALDVVFTLDAADTGEAALKVIQNLGYQIDVASFGLSEAFLQAIATGKAVFGIDQQYYLQGYLPVSLLAQNAINGIMPSGTIITGPKFITASKIKQYKHGKSKGIH